MDCLKRCQSDHTCHHSHRFNKLATKSEKWNGKPRLDCVDGRHPPSKTPVGILPWTCRSEGKRPSRQTGGQSNPHKWLASRKIWSVGKLETPHQWSPGEERRWKKYQTIFFGTVSKATLGKLPRDVVERIWAFPSAYIPSWTELNCYIVQKQISDLGFYLIFHRFLAV